MKKLIRSDFPRGNARTREMQDNSCTNYRKDAACVSTREAKHRFSIIAMIAICLIPFMGFAQQMIVVNNVADAGAGSFRQAIDDANSGDTITFASALAGQTIMLNSILTIEENLRIEGNGITLDGTNIMPKNESSQILEVLEGIVTIKCVHFTNGTAEDWGGAICNDNALVANGCTFYNNTTAGEGGAIGNYGDLALLGNIFYGNTAQIGHVIANNGSNMFNVGYNVYDNTSANFNFAGAVDMDITSQPCPFNTTTFRPTSNDFNIVPSAESHRFPIIDFYGAQRVFPSTAGAVEYSPYSLVDFTTTAAIIANPVRDNIAISLPDNVTHAVFTLYDVQGRELLKQNIDNNDRVSVVGLSTGIYVYHLLMDGKQQQGKLSIVK